MVEKLENPEDKYKGLFVCIDKDHKYFSVGNASFTIEKGQVMQHPPFELEPGAFQIFDSEQKAFDYIKKYKDVLVAPRRGKPVVDGDDGKTTTYRKEGVGERPSHQDMVDGAKELQADGSLRQPDVLTDADIDNLLDQNARTVKSKLDKANYTVADLRRIKKSERKNRKRISVEDYLTDKIAGMNAR